MYAQLIHKIFNMYICTTLSEYIVREQNNIQHMYIAMHAGNFRDVMKSQHQCCYYDNTPMADLIYKATQL